MPRTDTVEDRSAAEDKPPYISLTTLQNFFDRWGDGPVPPRIDKTSLDSYSGGTQTTLMATLRLIGYVDANGYVGQPLRDAVADTEARKAYLRNWARLFYSEQLALAEQGATAGMLHETFASYGYNGSTLRKAVVFYLALVDYLDLPTSPHFRAPKQSATVTGRRRGPRRVEPTPAAPAEPMPVPERPSPRGEETVVRIGDLATITIHVDAKWMQLPVKTITAMREAIAQLEALDDSAGEPTAS